MRRSSVSIGSVKITSETTKAHLDTETKGLTFTSHCKTFKHNKFATDINDFNQKIVQRTVHDFYNIDKFPTSIKSKCQEKN